MKTNDTNQLRRIVIAPYLNAGIKFYLTTWDTGRRDSRGSTYQAYRLSMGSKVIFSGDDYSPSPYRASDSNDCLRDLIGFLCLKPGDTDKEYFQNYTPDQLQFAEAYADDVSMEFEARFFPEEMDG